MFIRAKLVMKLWAFVSAPLHSSGSEESEEAIPRFWDAFNGMYVCILGEMNVIVFGKVFEGFLMNICSARSTKAAEMCAK